ncbi:MAG: hypothetical protein RDU76_05350 [Candidatus Edwardsbacteria bacterium]|nr:hypothetical protein [Candidatus Edwardsbacteria bacterium]
MEINRKLDRLNDINADEDSGKREAINVFSEIIGQLNGNPYLYKRFVQIIKKINSIINGKKQITEPQKRAIVSQIREQLKFISIDDIGHLVGGDHE